MYRREILNMTIKNLKELAKKVLKYVNDYTHINFELRQEGDTYAVGQNLVNPDGQEILVYYMLKNDGAVLRVIADNCKFSLDSLENEVKEAELIFPVCAKDMQYSTLALESPMTLDALDQELQTIVRERMGTMVAIMSKILQEKGR